MRIWASTTISVFISFVLLTGWMLCWLDIFTKINMPSTGKILTSEGLGMLNKFEYSLNCSNVNLTQFTCPRHHPEKKHEFSNLDRKTCPDYFRWIHEDLRPWKSSGITQEMVEKAKEKADFRLVIVKGKVYVEKFRNAFQTRDVYTIWGILQLLRLYPGEFPDLELMFNCGDRPRIQKWNHPESFSTSLPSPPPMFQYCADNESPGVLFPDWTFWGWAETNIRPWKSLLEDLFQGNNMTKWKDRVPYAFWKGNPDVSPNRVDLMSCNASKHQDWHARLYRQDWDKEIKEGFKNSKLEHQCTHRYKIYIEGRGWSVSEKYILACDSMVLFVKPQFHDFFSRSMVPLQHYWHIRVENKCRDINFAVEWGNKHPDKAEAIGKAGSTFIKENLQMEHVYDYMFHSLKEYAELLKFKPKIPKGAVEVCSETIACSSTGLWNKFMVESMVKSPSDTFPCALPPPYETMELQTFLEKKHYASRQVEKWQDEWTRGKLTKEQQLLHS